jgi:two-component system, response regulator PdtaR
VHCSKHSFASAGASLSGQTSAQQAIELAVTEAPHLIVMDIRLESKRDGIEAAIEIFQAKRIRSLFASAYYDADTRPQGGAGRATWMDSQALYDGRARPCPS